MDDSLSLKRELNLSKERGSPVSGQQSLTFCLKKEIKKRDINFVSSEKASGRTASLIQKIQVTVQSYFCMHGY